VILRWDALGSYIVTGDEPHYLVNGVSIFQDGDLVLDDDYRVPPFERLGPRWAHAFEVDGHWYPWRGLGAPLVVGLPFLIWGLLGAKLAMALVCSLLAIPLLRLAFRLTQSTSLSWFAALGIAASLPMLVAHNQIFPDAMVGYLVLAGFIPILALDSGRVPGRVSALLFALVLCALVWTYWRHLLTAAVLFVGLIVALRTRPQRQVDTGVWWILLLGGALAFGSIAVYLAEMGQLEHAGRVQRLGIAATLSGLLGQHLDQSCGLLFRNPLLWIAVPGWWLWMRRSPLSFVIAVLLFGVLAGPPSTAAFTYGGAGICGRYSWSYAPLWLIPLAISLAALAQLRGGRVMLVGVLGLGLAAQWIQSAQYLADDGLDLLRQGNVPRWLLISAWGEWRWWLPSFPSTQQFRVPALGDPVNLVWTATLGLAFVLPAIPGSLARHGRALRIGAPVLALILWAAGLSLLAQQQWQSEGVLSMRPGRISGAGTFDRHQGATRRLGETDLGWLKSGYLHLPQGRYRFEAIVSSAVAHDLLVGLVAHRPGRWHLGPMPQAVPEGIARVQFSVDVPANGRLAFAQFRMRRMPGAEGAIELHGVRLTRLAVPAL
jgi:hypothetical protein